MKDHLWSSCKRGSVPEHMTYNISSFPAQSLAGEDEKGLNPTLLINRI